MRLLCSWGTGASERSSILRKNEFSALVSSHASFVKEKAAFKQLFFKSIVAKVQDVCPCAPDAIQFSRFLGSFFSGNEISSIMIVFGVTVCRRIRLHERLCASVMIKSPGEP